VQCYIGKCDRINHTKEIQMLLQDQLREGYADECAEAIRTLLNKRREYLLGFRTAFVLGVGILPDEVDTIQGCLKELTEAEIREA
jgi:hypothetical protein